MAEQDLVGRIVTAARTEGRGVLEVARQVDHLGPNAAIQLIGHLSADARKVLFSRTVAPEAVQAASVDELATFYRFGHAHKLIGEEEHANALSPEVHAELPLRAVLAWITDGEWGTRSEDRSAKLRAAFLRVALEEHGTDPGIRTALLNEVEDDLLDTSKSRLIKVIKAARSGVGSMDEVLLGEFNADELAQCPKGSWKFLSDFFGALGGEEERTAAVAAPQSAAAEL